MPDHDHLGYQQTPAMLSRSSTITIARGPLSMSSLSRFSPDIDLRPGLGSLRVRNPGLTHSNSNPRRRLTPRSKTSPLPTTSRYFRHHIQWRGRSLATVYLVGWSGQPAQQLLGARPRGFDRISSACWWSCLSGLTARLVPCEGEDDGMARVRVVA